MKKRISVRRFPHFITADLESKQNKLVFLGQTLTNEARLACMLLVIDPKDLVPKLLKDFSANGLKLGIQTLRYNHYEAKRKLKLKAIENLIRKANR